MCSVKYSFVHFHQISIYILPILPILPVLNAKILKKIEHC